MRKKIRAENFVARRARWLMDKLALFHALPPQSPVVRYGRRKYLACKESARELVFLKIAQFQPQFGGEGDLVGVPYGRVSIRNQKTCWGSCSRKGNLNFNYKIIFLPERLQDYVIVHELAHLRELNHSQKFWALVESVIPGWRALRKELRATRMP